MTRWTGLVRAGSSSRWFVTGLGTGSVKHSRFLQTAMALLVLCVSASSEVVWTGLAPLNANAGGDSGNDYFPQVATDNAGRWVGVWHSDDTLGGTVGTDFDIFVARSSDEGATWSGPAPLNTNAGTDSGSDYSPRIVTDGAGHWVAVWQTFDNLGGTIGTEGDILVSRSADNGTTWTAPVALNTNAATDAGTDADPCMVTDAAGRWLAAWHSDTNVGGAIGADHDILVSRSTDHGATWTAPVPLNSNAGVDTGGDYTPSVCTDRAGRWVAVWQSNDSLGGAVGADLDILVARSVDNGLAWSAPAPMNSNASSDSGHDYLPRIATDHAGQWVVVWQSADALNGTIGTDDDILVSRSTNGGVTWTAPVALNSNARTDSGADYAPNIATDVSGQWVVAWHSNENLGGAIGTDYDILAALSVNQGAAWTSPRPLNRNAWTDTGNDRFPQVVASASGQWIGVWQSSDNLGGTIGGDNDILLTRSGPTTDSDGDGLPDIYETGTGVFVNPYDTGTDPLNPDSDGDSLPDGWEVTYQLDPNNPYGDHGADGDPDGDGYTNWEEYQAGTNPRDPDSVPLSVGTPWALAGGIFGLTCFGMLLLGRLRTRSCLSSRAMTGRIRV